MHSTATKNACEIKWCLEDCARRGLEGAGAYIHHSLFQTSRVRIWLSEAGHLIAEVFTIFAVSENPRSELTTKVSAFAQIRTDENFH